MPLWIFTLGKTIFDRGNLRVPYGQITQYAVGLIVPLAIGIFIQTYLPRVSRFLVRILKTFSSLLLVFIIVFAIISNLYLFQLFTWQVKQPNCAFTCFVANTKLFFLLSVDVDFRCWNRSAMAWILRWLVDGCHVPTRV